MYTLALDQGSNSIGWAVIETTSKKLIDSGVRIFQEGVNDLGQGEKEMSKNAARSEARQKRKQYFRKTMRKNMLIKLLQENDLCPRNQQEYSEWIKLNPYECRTRAIKEQVSLHQLGRAFFHISQRRGFLSNSKSAGANTDSAIFQSKNGKIGIAETQEKIKEDTLGSYLNSILPEDNKPFSNNQTRVRSRYTTRKMYMDEFNKIWNEQAKYHPSLTSKLRIDIGGIKLQGDPKDGILFFQRPLKSQKHLKGKCPFEPSKPRAPQFALTTEKVRIWQFINSIRCNGEHLSFEDKSKLAELMITKDKLTFKALSKQIDKLDSFYKFNYLETDKIVCAPAHSKLCSSNAFGVEFLSYSEEKQEDIWHVIYTFDNTDLCKKYALDNWNRSEKQAEFISKIFFKRDYVSLSKSAQTKILYFLEKGIEYDLAVMLAGVKKVLGLSYPKDDNQLISEVSHIARGRIKGGYTEPLKSYLLEHFEITEKHLKKLYHHSYKSNNQDVLDKLPIGSEADKEIQKIRNPIVITAIFELRRVINALLVKYKAFDTIKIEMARDLKKNKLQRQSIRINNSRREKERDEIIKTLESKNINPYTQDNILKYKLWLECNKTCPYTGDSISFTDLFVKQHYDIEHIIPYSRSLDDSFLNKTLCRSDVNRAIKANKTPYEMYQGDEWDLVKKRVLGLFFTTKEYPNRYEKFKRFVTKTLSDDFISRQLNDTRYISKVTKSYLEKICSNVQVSNGALTSKLRHLWGLNSIISIDDQEKNRTDHRHHAIDAIVVAYITRSFVQEASVRNRYKRDVDHKAFPAPYDGFWIDVKNSISSILVSYRKTNRVLNRRIAKTAVGATIKENLGVEARGQLHKETVYGKRTSAAGEKYHIRKSIEDVKTGKQIAKIANPSIQKLAVAYLETLGIDTSKSDYKIPTGTFTEKTSDGEVNYKLFLPNKNGDPVPIKKIRIAEEIGNAVSLKSDVNQFVNPRNNDHVLLYEDELGAIKESVHTFWEVAERIRQGIPRYQPPSDAVNIVAKLEANDFYLLGIPEGTDVRRMNKKDISHYLYRVQKISSKYYTFRHHLASTLNYTDQEVSIQSLKKWLEINPTKVSISPTGEIMA